MADCFKSNCSLVSVNLQFKTHPLDQVEGVEEVVAVSRESKVTEKAAPESKIK